MNEPYRENANDIRVAKVHEDAETERARIVQTEETKRVRIKENESTARSRGDGWIWPWVLSTAGVVLTSLIGYFAYAEHLESVHPVCRDEQFSGVTSHRCSAGAIGHKEGDMFVCSCSPWTAHLADDLRAISRPFTQPAAEANDGK
jgi:hypothetical protein